MEGNSQQVDVHFGLIWNNNAEVWVLTNIKLVQDIHLEKTSGSCQEM